MKPAAQAQLRSFLAGHPQFVFEGVRQPAQGGTNAVAFLRLGSELVVAKLFGEHERKLRECHALRCWSDTGLVPAIIWDADPLLVVMSHLPGAGLLSRLPEHGPDARFLAECRGTGAAMATLTRHPLSQADCLDFEALFYGPTGPFPAYLARILELAHGVVARDADFRDRMWTASLERIAAQVPRLLSEPRILYHQDASNLHVDAGRFVGFFDLEMVRSGGASMQLASVLGLLLCEPASWPAFAAGWLGGTQAFPRASLEAAAAGFHLLAWREITRYLSYDGTPGTGFAWAEPADPGFYRQRFAQLDAMLGLSEA